MLVRAGARLDYVDAGGRRRSVLMEGARWNGVRDWILIRRWTVRRLEMSRDDKTASDLDTEAVDGPEMKPWSGITKAKYRMTGSNKEYPRMPDESGIAFATRLAAVKRNLAGHSIVPYTEIGDGERTLSLFGRSAMVKGRRQQRDASNAP
jgi:hypothetical protein